VEFVLEHFGPESDEDLARMARDLDPAALRRLAARPEARVRRLVAGGLVRDEGLEDELRVLLDDADSSVVVAVLEALASSPSALDRARALEAQVRTRAGSESAAERVSALHVLALLRSPEVNDLALAALGDPDPSVQQGGVAALAEMAEPRSASLFASLLARGPGSPLYDEARRGLLRLGPAGEEECLRLARSSSLRARREAILLLCQCLAPEAALLTLELLQEVPSDERLQWELCVLSGVDLIGQSDPVREARAWWDLVVHDDPCAWLLSAAERSGIPAPSREALLDASGQPVLTPPGAAFLLDLAARGAPYLFERAVRELELRLGLAFERPGGAGQRPVGPAQRAQFVQELREATEARRGG